MQARFYGALRDPDNILNFRDFIAFRIVQQHDYPMLVRELRKRRIQPAQFFVALLVVHRVVPARQALDALPGQEALFDDMQTATAEPAPLVDEQVVHNAAQPRARFVDGDEVVKLAVRPDQQLLEQVLGVCLTAGEAKSETPQAVEVRPYQPFESLVLAFVANGYPV